MPWAETYTLCAQGCGELAAADPHRFVEPRPVRLVKMEWGPGQQAGARKAGMQAGCLSWPPHLFNPDRACGSGRAVPAATGGSEETHALHRAVFHADACTPASRGAPKAWGRGGRLDLSTRAQESESPSLNVLAQPNQATTGETRGWTDPRAHQEP